MPRNVICTKRLGRPSENRLLLYILGVKLLGVIMKSTHDYVSKMAHISCLETRYIFNNILISQVLQEVNGPSQHHCDAYPFSAKKVNWRTCTIEMQGKSEKIPGGSEDQLKNS